MDYIALLKSGPDKWALERASTSAFRAVLRDVNFVAEFGDQAFMISQNSLGWIFQILT